MSQNDYIIANQTAPNFRADLNNALQALASLSSGTSQPATTYANMLWYDTSNNILKMRTEADDAWINVGYLDQTSNAFRILDDTQVVNTSGTQTGLLGDQSTATWETGTATTESLVSPAKIKAAIDAISPSGVGVGQTWQDVSASRSFGTSYQNTTGQPIQVSFSAYTGISSDGVYRTTFQVSTDNSTWLTVSDRYQRYQDQGHYIIVPNNHYYRITRDSAGPGLVITWAELR